MLDGIAKGTCDRFLACYFVKGLRAPLPGNYLVGHVSVSYLLVTSFWPDPGLSRNTRCRCYRCSVPGLAGFTRRALCGARDLITHCRLSIADCQLPILSGRQVLKLAIGNWQLAIANVYISVLRCANIRNAPLINRWSNTYATS